MTSFVKNHRVHYTVFSCDSVKTSKEKRICGWLYGEERLEYILKKLGINFTYMKIILRVKR